EPAYGAALDWLLFDALGRIAADPAGAEDAEGAYYFRLTTRPIDQSPFEAARARLGDDVLRAQALAGAYRLQDAHHDRPELRDEGAPVVHLAASGAVMPEVLEAAEEVAAEGVAGHVVGLAR